MARPKGSKDKKPRMRNPNSPNPPPPPLGSVRNPDGRPRKGESMGEILRGIIKREEMEKICKQLVEDAMSEDDALRDRARRELFDRIDGRAKQAIEATGKDGSGLTINVTRFGEEGKA